MKKILILIALFPFLHATSYAASYVSCEKDAIVLKVQGEETKVSLFNIKMKEEESWNRACDILSHAKKLRIEVDPSSAIEEPLPVYLFADDELLQEALLKKEQAYIQIRNPEYTYEKRMESAVQEKPVVAQAADKDKPKRHAKNGPLFFASVLLMWAILLCIIIRIIRKKKV